MKSVSFFKIIYSILIFILIYFWSVYIMDYYTAGDQIIYNRFYKEAFNLSFLETYILSRGLLDAGEPGFSLIIFYATQYLERVNFVSVSNAILAVLLFQSVNKRKNLWLIFFFLITNYYVSVLFFSAERLKFAAILALIFLKMRPGYLKNVLLLIPSLFHFQYLLLLPVVILGLNQEKISSFIRKPSFGLPAIKSFMFIILGVCIFTFALRFSATLLNKFFAYSGSADIFDLIRVFILSGFLVFISKDRIIGIFIALYFTSVVLVLGAERIIIMEVGYIFSIIRLLDVNRAAAFLLIGSYFSFKTIAFYGYVFECGHGFVCK